jgi:hypothetical protein
VVVVFGSVEWHAEPLLSPTTTTNELLFFFPSLVNYGVPTRNRSTYLSKYLPWAIRVGSTSSFLMNVFYERRWEQDITELRDELKIETPPGVL